MFVFTFDKNSVVWVWVHVHNPPHPPTTTDRVLVSVSLGIMISLLCSIHRNGLLSWTSRLILRGTTVMKLI